MQDIAIISVEFKDVKIFDYPTVNTGRKWHHLDRDLWPIRHLYKLFHLGLAQFLITGKPMNYGFVENEE